MYILCTRLVFILLVSLTHHVAEQKNKTKTKKTKNKNKKKKTKKTNKQTHTQKKKKKKKKKKHWILDKYEYKIETKPTKQ